MRASEFISEGHAVGRISKRKNFATVGLHKFADTADRLYVLNRVMMAAAATDGTFVPDMDEKSWVGKHKTAHPYTPQEQDMLKMAFRAAGAEWHDLNHGDMDSEELPDTNTASPVKPFQGYPR